jgi:hypothetical protein
MKGAYDMDDGRGHFIQVHPTEEEKERIEISQLSQEQNNNPGHGGYFYVGQNLAFNNSRFRVLTIGKKTISLKLLPKGN